MARPSLKLATTRDPARDALAVAISDVEVARKNMEDARAAAEKAEQHVWAAADRLTALREDAAQASLSDAIITSLAAGSVDVAELERPEAETRAKIEGVERELAVWRRAREAAEQAVPVHRDALDWAQRRVKDAVGEVMRTVDVETMIASAERAREVLVAERCRLIQIRSSLPLFSEEHKAVDGFLSRPFLIHEFGDEWRDHPAVAPWREAFDALHRDADTPLPSPTQTEATVVILPANGRE